MRELVPSTPQLFLLFLAGGLVGALGTAKGATHGAYLGWYLPTWSMAFLAFWLGATTTQSRRHILVGFVIVYTMLLNAATISSAVVSINPFHINYRPSLWLENPNLLAAALAVASAASASLTRRPQIKLAIILLAFSALLFTGSRTGLLAFGISVVAVAFVDTSKSGGRPIITWAPVFGILIVLVSLVFLGQLTSREHKGINYIYPTDDFMHGNWKKPGLNVQVNQVSQPGPYPGGKVIRVQGQPNPDMDHSIIIYQSHGVAPEGFKFVSSVYARSDRPQWIEISANYTRADCWVSTEWTRCVSPVATGNGHGAIQLQINSVTQGKPLDIYLWGPQIEEGEIAGKVSHRPENVLATLEDAGVLARLNPTNSLRIDDTRSDFSARAWAAFIANPWNGVGFGNISAWEETELGATEISSRPTFTHAHNILLQHLAEGGLLGALSFLLPFMGTSAVAIIRSRLAALPIVIVVVVLNFTDYTFYHAWGHYVYWLSLGLSLSLPVQPTSTVTVTGEQPRFSRNTRPEPSDR